MSETIILLANSTPSMRFTISHSHSASGLIDVMVAVTIFAVMSTAALSVIRSSERGAIDLEKRSIAADLAEEGLNALINLRDTNYLRFSSDTENCWNTFGVEDVSECADTLKEIQEGGTYALSRSFFDAPLFEWNLEAVSVGSEGLMSLYNVDLDGDGNGDMPLYAQSGISDSSFILSEADLFSRTFTVEYAADGDSYTVLMTLTWDAYGMEKSVQKSKKVDNIY